MTALRKNWPWVLLLALSLVSLLVLLIVFRSFFIENILRPIGLIFWLGWRVITSVNQSFYWVMLILLSAFLVIRMLPKDSLPPQDVQKVEPNKIMNPYQDWLSSLTHSTSSPSGLEAFRQRLRELITSSVSLADRTTANEARAGLQADQSPISKVSQIFLFSENEVPRDLPGKMKLRMAFFLASLRRRRPSRVPKIIHQPVDEILSFLEEKAKSTHEH